MRLRVCACMWEGYLSGGAKGYSGTVFALKGIRPHKEVLGAISVVSGGKACVFIFNRVFTWIYLYKGNVLLQQHGKEIIGCPKYASMHPLENPVEVKKNNNNKLIKHPVKENHFKNVANMWKILVTRKFILLLCETSLDNKSSRYPLFKISQLYIIKIIFGCKMCKKIGKVILC